MPNDDLARFIDRYTVEYLRTFAHPVERVWKAIVDPAEIGQWFVPPTKWDLREGGSFRFHDDNVSGAILAFEPLRLIRFQDDGPGAPGRSAADMSGCWFQFELDAVEGGTRMRFTHHVTPGVARPQQPPHAWDTPWWPGMLGGWHASFDAMGDVIDGVPIGSRRPPTAASAIAEAWASHGSSVTLTPEQRAVIVRELRNREHEMDVSARYRAHVDATLPPGAPPPPGAA
ncbi:MAG TPA: SRPBCC domain-containing protein [Caulobacteraceae bacterium]|nr:SRPBCC domain-containing protein [Caulobacteraceae bacterium]